MAQTIRTAVEQDLDAIAAVEAECFPAAEAATRAEFAERLRYYGNHFWLLWEDETLAAFVDGMVTDAADLTDAMYADASLHNENGAWQMIFGVNTLPEYRRRGLAGKTAGKKGPCAHLQGQTGALLRPIRLCQRGRFRVCARRRDMVSDAADVLNAIKFRSF